MVTKITGLLQTVQNIESESGKGARALEATLQHIDKEMKVTDCLYPQKA